MWHPYKIIKVDAHTASVNPPYWAELLSKAGFDIDSQYFFKVPLRFLDMLSIQEVLDVGQC